MKNKNKVFLSISFSAGFQSPHIPIATFKQNDKELNFIIDTGADDNVINEAVLQDIEYEEVEHNGSLAAVGGVFEVKACAISFQYDKEQFKAKFLISNQLDQAFNDIRKAHAIPLHGMLGSKFLRDNNIVMDFKNLVAYNREL